MRREATWPRHTIGSYHKDAWQNQGGARAKQGHWGASTHGRSSGGFGFGGSHVHFMPLGLPPKVEAEATPEKRVPEVPGGRPLLAHCPDDAHNVLTRVGIGTTRQLLRRGPL